MKTKFVAAIALFAVLSGPAFAEDKAAPKVGKADVQKLVDSIKGDKAKFADYCALIKLQHDYQAAVAKKDGKTVNSLGVKMDEIVAKLGGDFDRVTSADMDDESDKLLGNLENSCK